MQDSNLLTYVAGELAILLLVVCIFLCVHVKKLKNLIGKLEDKVSQLRKSITLARKETKSALSALAKKEKIKPKVYVDYLDEEIDGTLVHHQALNPDRDIVLDIAPDAPIERQAASLRHAFLIAEKEARYAGEESDSSWNVLQAKLQQIIEFYESAESSSDGDLDSEQEEIELLDSDDSPDNDQLETENNQQEIENYKKQIENLGRYKKLFLDTEDKWKTAKDQADEYYRQLMEKTKEFDGNEELEELLDRYSHAYDDVGTLISGGIDDDIILSDDEGDELFNQEKSIGKTVIENQEEVQRLRNMAVDQHKVITQLKNQLVNAKSPEDHKEALEQISEQLERQQQFLKEAETCTQLIEDELSRALEENEQLRAKVEGNTDQSSVSDVDVEKLEVLVGELTAESKKMLQTIATLEAENDSLKQKIENTSDESPEQTEQLKEKLSELQQELLNMQTQHIELEERYLELKMSSI